MKYIERGRLGNSGEFLKKKISSAFISISFGNMRNALKKNGFCGIYRDWEYHGSDRAGGFF